jgi:proprotein convertase subtilisin/kexin type 5
VAGQPYYLDANHHCVVICPTDTYPDPALTCTACTAPCLTCAGGSSLCTSCDGTSATPYLKYGAFTCAAACPAGQYASSSSYVCAPCSSNCLTCNTASTDCLSCGLSISAGLPLYLSSNTCVANCPFGYFGATGNVCSSCDGSCSGCTHSNTNCISCAASYFRRAGSTLCVINCPAGYYTDSTSNLCTLCPSGCKLCSVSSSIISCSQCQKYAGVMYYLDSTTANCVPTCPSTYYPSPTVTPTCESCTGNCITCTGASSCITCVADTYLWLGDTVCTGDCPDGQYHPASVGKCSMCSSFCLTCSLTATNCTSCTSVGGVAYFLNASNCLPLCPKGKYGELSGFTCTGCADGCASCFGSSNTTCYSCKSFSSTNYYLEYGEFNCLTNCPDGQYANATAFKCLLCSANCLTCSSSGTHCLTCGFSTIGLNLFLSSNKCVANCPQGQWGNSSDYTCTNCADGCMACSGPSLDNCTLCGNYSSSTYYKHIGVTVCNTTCPGGQFISANIPNFCQQCSSICVTCNDVADNCTSQTCAANLFYLNYECLSLCPNHYYPDRSARQCKQCATGCSTCFGADNSSCTVCSSSFYLQMGSNTCSSGCSNGEFANGVGNVCTLCAAACATCTSPTLCQSCDSVNGIAYFLDTDKCTVKCPSTQFGKLSDFTCTNCAGGCATCFDAGLNSCYSCGNDGSAVPHFLVYGTDTCDPDCPNGQYKNTSAFKCLLCSSVCATCSLNSTHCLSCGMSPFGYAVFLNGDRCLAACPTGLWPNATAFTCDSCAVGCAACFGYGLANCTVCGNDSMTIYYKWINDTVCSTTCPGGQFISSTKPHLCQPCSPICVTCEETAENCTSSTCPKNYYFLSHSCLSICPNNYYPDSSARQCLGCATGCSTCFGSADTSCTVCSSSYYLQIGSTTCSSGCNPG